MEHLSTIHSKLLDLSLSVSFSKDYASLRYKESECTLKLDPFGLYRYLPKARFDVESGSYLKQIEGMRLIFRNQKIVLASESGECLLFANVQDACATDDFLVLLREECFEVRDICSFDMYFLKDQIKDLGKPIKVESLHGNLIKVDYLNESSRYFNLLNSPAGNK